MRTARIARGWRPPLAAGPRRSRRPQDEVSLRLNWYLGGLHVPFYYGKEKGYFEAEGIDLTINEGRGSGNTAQVVAAGSDTFGMADSSSPDRYRVQGRRHQDRDVDAQLDRLLGGLARRDRHHEPKDLEGKKVAVSPGDPLGQLLEAVCKANDVDCTRSAWCRSTRPPRW